MFARIMPAGLASASLLLCGCAHLDESLSTTVGTANLTYADGQPAGTAALIESNGQLDLKISVVGMSPGEHGFHLHSVGQCQGPDFKSAGGHLNPDARSHGKMSSNPSHLGDLPNLQVGENGTASAQIAIRGQAKATLAKIFDRDGTAIVIHADPDDYRSQPAGNAGSRIACGVLRPAA